MAASDTQSDHPLDEDHPQLSYVIVCLHKHSFIHIVHTCEEVRLSAASRRRSFGYRLVDGHVHEHLYGQVC